MPYDKDRPRPDIDGPGEDDCGRTVKWDEEQTKYLWERLGGNRVEAMADRLAERASEFFLTLNWAAGVVEGEGRRWEAEGNMPVALSFFLVAESIRKRTKEVGENTSG